jgi:hypothetical protein
MPIFCFNSCTDAMQREAASERASERESARARERSYANLLLQELNRRGTNTHTQNTHTHSHVHTQTHTFNSIAQHPGVCVCVCVCMCVCVCVCVCVYRVGGSLDSTQANKQVRSSLLEPVVHCFPRQILLQMKQKFR